MTTRSAFPFAALATACVLVLAAPVSAQTYPLLRTVSAPDFTPQASFYNPARDEIVVISFGGSDAQIYDSDGDLVRATAPLPTPLGNTVDGATFDGVRGVGLVVRHSCNLIELDPVTLDIAASRSLVGSGSIAAPTVCAGVDLGSDGLLYVLDNATSRVLVYPRDGTVPLRTFSVALTTLDNLARAPGTDLLVLANNILGQFVIYRESGVLVSGPSPLGTGIILGSHTRSNTAGSDGLTFIGTTGRLWFCDHNEDVESCYLHTRACTGPSDCPLPFIGCDTVRGECRSPVCGDEVVEGGEECDDGGTMSGDGCSAGCVLERAPNGTACGSGTTCRSGFCVDGVCCDSACGGGASDDCMACGADTSVAGTCGALRAAVASMVTCRDSGGICDVPEVCSPGSMTCPSDAFVSSATVCRSAGGVCDTAERCTGSSAACPSDVLVGAGTPCRASAGVCDVVESCTGASVGCPPDAFAPAAQACRPSAGVCDSTEFCPGDGASCPSDSTLPIGTLCRAATGMCDVAETCNGFATCPTDRGRPDGTACSNGAVCDGSEVCTAGVCGSPGPLACDDGNACTADVCREPGGCATTAVPGCCNLDGDCASDGNVCTRERCSGAGGSCSSLPTTGCCTRDSDCTGGSTCSPLSCNLATNRCETRAVPGCCSTAADCSDGNPCTSDSCVAGSATCSHSEIAGCCVGDGDCDDMLACTTDACVANRCTATPISGCCAADTDCVEGDANACTEPSCNGATGRCEELTVSCDDLDACTADACEADGSCSHTARDCDDGDACTADSCAADGSCVNEPIAGCGSDAGMMVGDDAGVPLEDAGMASPDAAVMVVRDAGRFDAAVDAATDAGDITGADASIAHIDAAFDAGTSSLSGGGCGCTVPGAAPSGPRRSAVWALALLGLLLARRRAQLKSR
ncbi:MAG: hypothetical protein J0L92_36940 [Deltaproteobacteria bacterium]|nr:hypothetical protein [Deltaproteobacteria bacterium]